ncbi:hypothetical protein D3C80_1627280 [compost metagenome]
MRLDDIAARAQHHEFLTTQPTEHVGAPQPVVDALAQAAQHMIAHCMAELIVDPLEMVDVQHDDGQVLLVAMGTLQFRLEPLLEIASVVDAGQGIRH